MSILKEFMERKWLNIFDRDVQYQRKNATSDMEAYAHIIEMVPIQTLKKYREFDRLSSPIQTPEEWERTKQSIQQNGWTSPLIVIYFTGDKTAILGEGNHRIAIAEQLGLTEAPVRVLRYSGSIGAAQGAKPVRGYPPNKHGYVPGDLKPSDIGLI